MTAIKISASLEENRTTTVAKSAGSTSAAFTAVSFAQPRSLDGSNSNDDAQALLGTSGFRAVTGSLLGDPKLITLRDQVGLGKYTTTDGDLNTLTSVTEINTTGLLISRDGRYVNAETGDYVTPDAITVNFPIVSASGDLAARDGRQYPGYYNFKEPSKVKKELFDPREI